MSWEIREGHVLDLLEAMPAESVQCAVTSPPYWGLRAYGTEPQVWGGDPGCGHVWGEPIRTPWANSVPGPSSNHPKNGPAGHWTPKYTGPLCTLCGAWKGELGSEPTIQAFIQHLVEVFRAVKRVLRRDGVMFLNIGDGYSGSGKGPTGHNGIGDQVARQGFGGHGSRLNSRHGDVGHTSGVSPHPGTRAKSLLLVPERLAIALADDGWIVRSRIAWCKKAPMPESVRDRPTNAWEHIWMLTREPRYYWDQEAVREKDVAGHASGNGFVGRQGTAEYQVKSGWAGTAESWQPGSGRNLWNYWTLSPAAFPGAHFATFPPEIPKRCIVAATSEYGACSECGAPWARVTAQDETTAVMGWAGLPGVPREILALGWSPTCRAEHATVPVRPCVVLDPFAGSGTTPLVADRLGRHGIGLELNPKYADMARRRIADDAPLFAEPGQD